MVDKKVYFVVGAESAGTRYLTRVLIAAGCDGDAKTKQRLDNPAERFKADGRIVLRRSFPYGEFPEMGQLEQSFTKFNAQQRNEFTYLIIVRDSFTLERSQAARKLSKDIPHARRTIADAYKRIFLSLRGCDYRIVCYSSLVSNSAYRRALLADIGLNPDAADAVEATNEDDKYLAEQAEKQPA